MFVVILAVAMLIIYGGIQPDGLVLSVHKFTVDTSKAGKPVVDPLMTTLPPTTYSTPKPIRGTVKPLSKWGPYDRYKPRNHQYSISDSSKMTTNMVAFNEEQDKVIENWLRKFGMTSSSFETTVSSVGNSDKNTDSGLYGSGFEKSTTTMTDPELLVKTEIEEKETESVENHHQYQISKVYTSNDTEVEEKEEESTNLVQSNSIRTALVNFKNHDTQNDTTLNVDPANIDVVEIGRKNIPALTTSTASSSPQTFVNNDIHLSPQALDKIPEKSKAQIKISSQYNPNSDSSGRASDSPRPPVNPELVGIPYNYDEASDIEQILLSTLDRLAKHYQNFTK